MVCLCGAGHCNTPEAIAERAARAAIAEAARLANLAAFETYYAARQARRGSATGYADGPAPIGGDR